MGKKIKNFKDFHTQDIDEANDAMLKNADRVRNLVDCSDDKAKELAEKIDMHFTPVWGETKDKELRTMIKAVAELEGIKI